MDKYKSQIESYSKVSVLIPTYNRSNYIEECLNSLLVQTIPPLEIIVIDDGSEDDTAERLLKYKEQIIYLHKDNGGKPSALNLGLKKARGEYIWLFDDDDVALPESIEMRQRYLDAHQDIDFVFTSHYWGMDDDNGEIKRGALYVLPKAYKDSVFPELLKGCSFTLQSVLARKQVYEVVGDFDENLITSEDYDMLIRMAHSFSGAGLDKPSFIFRQHQGLRGPSQARFSGADRDKTFRQYDQAVGRKIRELLPLDSYRCLNEIEYVSSDLQSVVDLLSRMVVMASKGLLTEMMEDLKTSIELYQQKNIDVDQSFPGQYCAQSVYTGYATEAILQDWPCFSEKIKQIPSSLARQKAILGFAKGFFVRAKSYPGSLIERSMYLYRSALCLLLLLK